MVALRYLPVNCLSYRSSSQQRSQGHPRLDVASPFYFGDYSEGALAEPLRSFPVALVSRRFVRGRTISAFIFPYFVILMRSPRIARSTSLSSLRFAPVTLTVSMTAYACNSDATF